MNFMEIYPLLLVIKFRCFKLAFHDADTDTDILARIVARMSTSAPWNACFIMGPMDGNNYARNGRESNTRPLESQDNSLPNRYITQAAHMAK